MIKLLFGSKYYPQAFFKKFVKEKNTKSFVKQVFEKLKSDDLLFVSRDIALLWLTPGYNLIEIHIHPT